MMSQFEVINRIEDARVYGTEETVILKLGTVLTKQAEAEYYIVHLGGENILVHLNGSTEKIRPIQ